LRSARIAATPAGSANNDYLDIQAGWRLTAVTPILKSGGYVLKTTDKPTGGNGFTLSAGTDFVGYEVAHYDVKGQRGGRVRVEFNSAEVTKDGQTQPQPQSIAPLFQVARQANYLRLIYLIRISQADHNMAIVAARKLPRSIPSLGKSRRIPPAVAKSISVPHAYGSRTESRSGPRC